MSGLANITINSICVYSKHYYVSDLMHCRLVILENEKVMVHNDILFSY